MPLINFTNPFTALVALVLFVLSLFLSRELKRKWPMMLVLFAFLLISCTNTVEYFMAHGNEQYLKTIATCIGIDFVFVFLSFISYLWMDDIEAKEKKQKTVSNSLDWFWKKV
ncbi:MAG: hypothetical protein J6M60_07375 [Clostridia bacterium]|nr:hypothetical protein [Clostridia bacterium]